QACLVNGVNGHSNSFSKTDGKKMKTMALQLEQMVEAQRKKLLEIAKRLIPHLTGDDILQPQDYPELDTNPEFRYEEGVLVGLETALSALSFLERDQP